MAAIADLSDLVNRATGGNSGTPETRWTFRDNRVSSGNAATAVQGRWISLWRYNGQPSGGDNPTTAANPTNTTPGSLMQSDPGGGRQKWLVGGTFCASQPGTLLVYDRLAHIGDLDATITTTQTMSLSVSRYTGTESVGNQIWIEIYSLLGSTPTTVTVSYTNQAGTSGRTTVSTAFGGVGLRDAQRWIPLPLQSGDTGVRSVESLTLAGTTNSSGNFGVTLVRPLMIVALPTLGLVAVRSLLTDVPAFVEIKAGACIAFSWFSGNANTATFFNSLTMIEA